MAVVVVTGTNTDVGKTIAVAKLAVDLRKAGWEVKVFKPAQTGEPEGHGDRFTVERLVGEIEHFECARYPEPLAPNLSARRAGMQQLTCEEIVDAVRAVDDPQTIVLVEGAGGLLVRIADDLTICDVAARLNAPLVVVTSTGLGSLNLAELAVEAAQRRGVTTLGLIGGSIPAEPDLATRLNLDEFPVVTGVPLLGCIPAGAGSLTKEAFAALPPLDVAPFQKLQ